MSISSLTVKKILSNEEMEEKQGNYFGSSHYHTIISEDRDVFKENGELLIRFRKKVIPEEFYKPLADSLRNVSMKKHDNRGASSGVLDKKKMPNYVGDWINSSKFRTHYTRASTGLPSKHYISNLSPSNIIGYYEKKDRNKPNGPPCRLTAFSEKETQKWHDCLGFFECVDNLFQKYIPDKHQKQLNQALISPEFRISNTCFSTVTVNYSWRTACHKDKGDFEDGFGTLFICEDYQNPNNYKGCYLGFPQYGVCVDCRQGDFLGVDVHEWHCNTEFVPVSEPKKFLKLNEKDFNNDWHYNRLSIVCYLRKNMKNCVTTLKK